MLSIDNDVTRRGMEFIALLWSFGSAVLAGDDTQTGIHIRAPTRIREWSFLMYYAAGSLLPRKSYSQTLGQALLCCPVHIQRRRPQAKYPHHHIHPSSPLPRRPRPHMSNTSSGRPKQFLDRNTKTENDTSEKPSFGRNQLIYQTISVLAKTVSFGRNSIFWPKQSL